MKYIIGLIIVGIALNIFYYFPALFFITLIVAVVWWLAYNCTIENDAKVLLNRSDKKKQGEK